LRVSLAEAAQIGNTSVGPQSSHGHQNTTLETVIIEHPVSDASTNDCRTYRQVTPPFCSM
jgi:hypothetical protein